MDLRPQIKKRVGLFQNPHCHSERSEESHVFLFKSKNQKRDPSALRPQDDNQRLNDKHQRNDNLVRHSERSEESHVFNEFLTRRIMLIIFSILKTSMILFNVYF